MRVFLSGQRRFGHDVLNLLLDMGLELVGVAAPPEDSRGRQDILWRLAGAKGLPRWQPQDLNASTLPEDVDLVVCAHSHAFVGKKTRLKTKLGGIGFHPSLLPLHRGRDAIYWTLRLGERVTGGTVYWLSDNVDGGPIAAQDWCLVRPDDTPSSLWQRELQPMGLRLMAQVMDDLRQGVIVAIPQDERLATWEPSVNRPPLYRPDLEQIGPPPQGFQVIRRRAKEPANPWVEAYG
jgi:methionyl-tRNA formyltransferase